MADPDFTLSDGVQEWQFTLADDVASVRQDIFSEDHSAIDLRSQNKRIGDFDEQSNWKAGHGVENFSENPEGFFDTDNAFTLNKKVVHSGLQWYYADGLRSNDTLMPSPSSGSVRWNKMCLDGGGGNYIAVSFVASASYNATIAEFWLRKVGTPRTGTFELCANGASKPGTVLRTDTVTFAEVTDTISLIFRFDFTAQALVAGTTYWLKFYTSALDRTDNCWEVATNVDSPTGGLRSVNGTSWAAWYKLYYRVTNADIPRRFWSFRYNGLTYSVSNNDDGTAGKLYVNGDRGKATSATSTTLTNTNKSAVWVASNWIGAKIRIIAGPGKGKGVRTITANTTTQVTVSPAFNVTPTTASEYIIYETATFIEVGTTGLTDVTGKPVVIGGIVYFPQGAAADIRRMRFNPAAAPPAHEFAADTSNKADKLVVGDDPAVGPVIWASLSGNVKRSPKKAWGTNLVFTAVNLGGDPEYASINGMVWGDRKLWACKDDRLFSFSGLTPIMENIGLDKTPSSLNGQAIEFMNGQLFISRLHSVLRVFGGEAVDVGLSWRGTELPEEKSGTFAGFEEAMGWLFAAVDGNTAKSGVRVYDGLNWHEIFTGMTGRRVRDVSWQPMAESYYRLWIDYGGDMIYIDFPPYTNVPSKSTQARYMHETFLVSAWIDMGSSARLFKLISQLSALTKNLGEGRYIGVDYQMDTDDAVTDWIPADPLSISPQDTVQINAPNILKFRYRFRMNTNNSSLPIIVYSVSPNGYARIPYKIKWSVRVRAGEMLEDSRPANPDKMYRWLIDVSRSSRRIRMTSKRFPTMDGFWVVVTPPALTFTRAQADEEPWQGSIPFDIIEESAS